MKPLHLKMSAFGPYAGEQVIDFAPLCERDLFLIHGPTGGGKTTILDAICFALFGETSGDRTGEQMRSQLADAGTPTAVELIFAIGENRYRVTRKPRQTLPGRGGKPREQQPEAALVRIVDGEDDPIAERANKVTEAVTTLLGFSADQFRQVIMLPQGKFRELLLAGSNQREAILEALFGTSLYERLQEAIAEEARSVNRKLKEQADKREVVLAQAQVANDQELQSRIEQGNAELLIQKDKIAKLEQAAKTAREELNKGTVAAEKLGACKAAETRVREAERQGPEIAKRQEEIAGADRAQRVAPSEQEYRGRASEVPVRQKALADANARQAQAAQGAAAAKTRLATAQQGIDAANEHRQQLGKVRALEARIGRLVDAGKALEQAAIAQEAHERRQREARAEQQKNADVRKLLAGEVTRLQAQAAQLEGLRQSVAEAKRLLDARTALDGLLPLLEKAQRDLAAATVAESKSQKALDAAREHQRLLLIAWKNSSAARLATELKPAEACPVCGSREHPAPATVSGEIPSEQELNAAQAAVDAADATKASATNKLSRCREELGRLEEQQRAKQEALAGEASAGAEFQQKLAALQKDVRSAEEAQKKLPGHEKQAAVLEKELMELEERLKSMEAEVQAARDAATAARTARDECLADLPELLRTPDAWAREVARLEALVKTAEQEFAESQKASQAADNALATAASAAIQANAELEQAKLAADAAKQAFTRALAEQQFASEHEYVAARLLPQQVAQKQDWIRKAEREIQEAQGALAQAQSAAQGLTTPDLASLTGASNAADQAHKDALKAGSEQAAQCRALANLASQLKQIAAGFAELERENAIVGRLSDTATGTNPRRLNFHRYVLSSLLDEVLWAASQRLKTMSRGRYRLERVKEVGDRRTSGGLELEVFDAHTGQSRPVATLSGGESFQASLSLSLGLADVVQNRSGGIRMETMFIDEGFGSLDAEALDEAMEAIRDLQKGGRVVGIISHVPELRQLVSARIEIVTTGRGSSARIHCL